jgi:hypothetical protein
MKTKRRGLNVVKLFEMLGIEEIVVADDVKFLKGAAGQLGELEQLPVRHSPRCKNRNEGCIRCGCVKTTRVRVKATV